MTQRILGPTGGRRRRRLTTFVPLGLLAALVLAIGAAAGPVSIAAGFQGDDGDLADNGDGIDWNSFDPVQWNIGTFPYRQAEKSDLGWNFLGIEDDAATNTDTAFAGGTKQDDNCATVQGARAPNKDDLKRIYLASRVDSATGNVYLALAWVRIPQNTTSPSAHIAFEFNQSETACPAGSDGLVQRTPGDLLFVYDFEGGSADIPRITVREWVTSGSCEVGSNSPPCWGPSVDLTTAGFAEARVNTSAVGSVLDALAPPTPPATESVNATLGLNEFGEAIIDLTGAGIFDPGTCRSFGNAFAVSRSSGNSATAQMKDLAGPGDFELRNCGTIIIKKRTIPRGIDQDFSFTSNIAGTDLACAPDLTPDLFVLNDKAGTDTDDPPAIGGNTERCDNVPAGTYTVTEGADPAGFEFVDVVCDPAANAVIVGKTATITLEPDDVVTCIYTNRRQLGAILITKTRKHAAAGSGSHPHPGVTFTVDGRTGVTDANGQLCFGGLAFGTYTVTETLPSGYAADGPLSQQVTVDNNATCSDSPYGGESVSFSNTPLTNLTVSVDSQVDGGTASTIDCVVVSGSTGPNGDGSVTAIDLQPGTYTCTIVIDP
jgi:hypothetical protein